MNSDPEERLLTLIFKISQSVDAEKKKKFMTIQELFMLKREQEFGKVRILLTHVSRIEFL